MATGRSHHVGARRKKPPKEVSKILGERPNLQFSLSLINLTISTASLTLVVTDTGQVYVILCYVFDHSFHDKYGL